MGALFFEVAFPFAVTSYAGSGEKSAFEAEVAGLFFTALGLCFHTGIYFLQGSAADLQAIAS